MSADLTRPLRGACRPKKIMVLRTSDLAIPLHILWSQRKRAGAAAHKAAGYDNRLQLTHMAQHGTTLPAALMAVADMLTMLAAAD